MPLPTTEQGSFGTPRKPRRPRLPSVSTSSSSAGVNPYAAKQSFPDQTIQQVQVRPPVTTSYRPTQFESQFKTFMESFAPSTQGASPVGPEPIVAGAIDPTDLMPEMVKEYEGRLFSHRSNTRP